MLQAIENKLVPFFNILPLFLSSPRCLMNFRIFRIYFWGAGIIARTLSFVSFFVSLPWDSVIPD
jgi:hypothetical protein